MGVFEKAVASGEQILEYIPQRPPIVMVDSFYGVEGDTSVTALTVAGDNIFCEDDRLSESGVIEHMAQSAAVRSGFDYLSRGKDVAVGYIGAVEKFFIHRQPRVGEVLRTTIVHEQEVMNITLVSASVSIDGEEVAGCRMKIFLEQ